jgi:hypothetical protein
VKSRLENVIGVETVLGDAPVVPGQVVLVLGTVEVVVDARAPAERVTEVPTTGSVKHE